MIFLIGGIILNINRLYSSGMIPNCGAPSQCYFYPNEQFSLFNNFIVNLSSFGLILAKPLIIIGIMILICGILEKRTLWLKKNKRRLNIVAIIIFLICLVALVSFVWLTTCQSYYEAEEKNLEIEHHYLCEDEDCQISGLGDKDMPVVKWLNDNELSIIITTRIGTGGSILEGVVAELQPNNKIQICVYEDLSLLERHTKKELSQCSEFIVKNIPRGNYQGNIIGCDVGPFLNRLHGVDFEIPSENQIYLYEAPTTDIASLKEFCIISNGYEFNDQCKNMPIEMENLYLYPGKHEYQDFFDFFLYNADTYHVYSDSMDNFSTQGEETYMNICIEEKSELYYKVKNKVDVLDKPISANIKGRVNSTHLCNSNGCDPVMFITLDNIIYNEK